MKKKNSYGDSHIYSVIAVILAILVLANNYSSMPTVFAVADLKNLDYSLAHLDELKLEYNNQIDRVPNYAKTIFGNERIIVYITRLDGSRVVLSAETKNGELLTLTTNSFSNYTMEVRVSEKTIDDIESAPKPADRLMAALTQKEIDYKALRFSTSAKIWFSRIFLRIYGLFR